MAIHKRKAAIMQHEEVLEGASDTLPPLDDANDVGVLLKQAPEVTQSVVDLENAKTAEAEAQVKAAQAIGATYSKEGFNPAIHEADASGQPVMTPTGRFKKKGSRPSRKGETPRANNSTLGGIPHATGGESLAQMTNAQTAAVVTQLKETMLVVTISDEFAMSAAEKAAEGMLLTAALNHSYPDGMPVNPWLAYSAAVVAHAASRFSQPKTQTWLQRQKIRFATIYLKMKGRKLATHSSHGSNNVGKNDISGQQDEGAQNTKWS